MPAFERVRTIFRDHQRIIGIAIQLQMFDSKPGQIISQERTETRKLFWLAVAAMQDKLAKNNLIQSGNDVEQFDLGESGL